MIILHLFAALIQINFFQVFQAYLHIISRSFAFYRFQICKRGVRTFFMHKFVFLNHTYAYLRNDLGSNAGLFLCNILYMRPQITRTKVLLTLLEESLFITFTERWLKFWKHSLLPETVLLNMTPVFHKHNKWTPHAWKQMICIEKLMSPDIRMWSWKRCNKTVNMTEH